MGIKQKNDLKVKGFGGGSGKDTGLSPYDGRRAASVGGEKGKQAVQGGHDHQGDPGFFVDA